MEDPYYGFKEEIDNLIKESQNQTKEWEVLKSSSSGIQRSEWLKAETLVNLEKIRKQLLDLEKMNGRIAANPTKFSISQNELDQRRSHVSKSREIVFELESILNSSNNLEKKKEINKDKLHRAKIEDNQNFIDSELNHQQAMLKRQDNDLTIIEKDVGTINQIAKDINEELNDSNLRMKEINNKMDNTTDNLERATSKMKLLLNSDDCWLIIASIALTILLLVLIYFAILY